MSDGSFARTPGRDALVGPSIRLAGRSVRRMLRQPQVLVPNLFFPAFFLVVNAAALGQATRLGGFSSPSYLRFVLPGIAAQAVMLSSTSAGSEMAIDIQSGFFERLLAAPVGRSVILVGHLAGVGLVGALLSLAFALAVAPFGAAMAAGPVGYATLAIGGGLLAVALGAVSAAVGIATGSVEAVHGTFPFSYVAIVVSSAYFPVPLMRPGYRRLAAWNPITWLVDGARDLTLGPLHAGAVLRCAGTGAVLAVGGVIVAHAALHRRLGRR